MEGPSPGTRLGVILGIETSCDETAAALVTQGGWEEPLDGIDDVSRLPSAARSYVEYIERALGVEVSLIGTGRARENVLAQRGLEAIARP